MQEQRQTIVEEIHNEQNNKSKTNPNSLQTDQIEQLYCIPCFKRGIQFKPAAYINLNQFQKNRYICNQCSCGQSYLIQINQVQMQKQKTSTDRLTQSQLQDTTQFQGYKQFKNNIQINFITKDKYLQGDLQIFVDKINFQYQNALQVITNYEQLIDLHIKNWKNKVKVQFQGVIQTFSNQIITKFYRELQKLQVINTNLQQINSQIKVSIQSKVQLAQQLVKLEQDKKIQDQIVQIYVKTLEMSGTRNLSNLQSVFSCTKGFSQAIQILMNLQYKQTNRRFDFITQKLKVCAIDTLYDAQMISFGVLDNKIQKPPIFEADQIRVSQRINSQYQRRRQQIRIKRRQIRNAINPFEKNKANQFHQKRPNQFHQKRPNQIQKNQSHQVQSDKTNQIQKSKSNQIHQNPIQSISLISQQNVECLSNAGSSLQGQQGFGQVMRTKNEQKIRSLKSSNIQRLKQIVFMNKKPFQSAILNQNKQTRDQTMLRKPINNTISIQSDQPYKKPLPYPSMQPYHSYQANQNQFISEIALTKDNYVGFPPNNLYLRSVEQLTLEYCPVDCQPMSLVKSFKCFSKLKEIVIKDKIFVTNNVLYMIAQCFPKLQSLKILCDNKFSRELETLFINKCKSLNILEVKNYIRE